MKHCWNCGKEIEDNDIICNHCGCDGQHIAETDADGADITDGTLTKINTFGWGALGFIAPVAGLILYLVWYKTQPRKAKAAGSGALINVIAAFVCSLIVSVVEIVLSLLMVLFLILLAAAAVAGSAVL